MRTVCLSMLEPGTTKICSVDVAGRSENEKITPKDRHLDIPI